MADRLGAFKDIISALDCLRKYFTRRKVYRLDTKEARDFEAVQTLSPCPPASKPNSANCMANTMRPNFRLRTKSLASLTTCVI